MYPVTRLTLAYPALDMYGTQGQQRFLSILTIALLLSLLSPAYDTKIDDDTAINHDGVHLRLVWRRQEPHLSITYFYYE